ncbi:MAG TPA: trehalose-phosphatase [Nitrolancea sp.]|nr:trehalose-phosphatase [Nitrolancea sp.]
MSENDLLSELYMVLSERPAGLLSDIDGTLSKIAPRPEDAVVDEAMLEALRLLTRQLDLVGVVTGRSAHDAEQMLGLKDLVYVGNHGMERVDNGRLTVVAAARPFVAAIAETLNAVRVRYPDPHVLFENKGLSGSIHYRLTTDPELAQEELLELVAPLARAAGLELTLGRMIIELRPPVRANKGTALAEIAGEHKLRSLIYLGDDITDLDAMRMLRELRDSGKINGLSIGVLDVESPVAIAQTADRTVVGVNGARTLLTGLAARLAESGRTDMGDQSASSG